MKIRIKRTIWMLAAVTTMGLCISLLWIADMGTDPCTLMNQSVAQKLHMSFGTYQLLINICLFAIVLLTDRKLIGPGTIGNMVVVGYAADFFSYLWHEVCGVPDTVSFGVRLAIFLPTVAVFVISAAVYMNSGTGTAPYDALPFIIHNRLIRTKRLEHLNFRVTRTCWDAAGMLVAVLAGGKIGAMTVMTVLFMGTAVEWVGRKWKI